MAEREVSSRTLSMGETPGLGGGGRMRVDIMVGGRSAAAVRQWSCHDEELCDP